MIGIAFWLLIMLPVPLWSWRLAFPLPMVVSYDLLRKTTAVSFVRWFANKQHKRRPICECSAHQRYRPKMLMGDERPCGNQLNQRPLVYCVPLGGKHPASAVGKGDPGGDHQSLLQLVSWQGAASMNLTLLIYGRSQTDRNK